MSPLVRPMAISAALIALHGSSAAYAGEPVSLEAFKALARPAPTSVLHYGSAASQAVDLFLPSGNGPHPVAILIHGGCWRDLPGAGREQLRHLGADLASDGLAVWSIGYRRADEPGGGYPGTFQDVALAIDRLRTHALHYGLDLTRTALVGHSAGGHLALWASTRDRLPAASPLYRDEPFLPGAVISLAGIGNLETFSRFVPVLCGPGVIEKLVPTADSAKVYGEVSPAARPHPNKQVVMISGILDSLVPPYVAYDYARVMQRKQANAIELVDIPGAGHFDLVTPGTTAWANVKLRIISTLQVAPSRLADAQP